MDVLEANIEPVEKLAILSVRLETS
jgi:hypothetical protein